MAMAASHLLVAPIKNIPKNAIGGGGLNLISVSPSPLHLYHHHPWLLAQSSSLFQVVHHHSQLLFSTSSAQSPKTPSKGTSSSWERSAKLVKNTDVTNPYLEQVRSEVVDPALQLKTIEDELCGAIGKALGRQGEKVLFAIREMEGELGGYKECLRTRSYDTAVEAASRYNEARKRAIKARWELLVHRQAVGFTVDNHSVVHTTFPIGEPLPVKVEDMKSLDPESGDVNNDTSPKSDRSAEDQPTKKVWGDQLAWWQRVGRWK